MDGAFMVLFALFSPFLLLGMVAAANNGPQIVMLAVNQVIPDPNQPRKFFAQDKLEQLAAHIQARGEIFNAILVRWDQQRQIHVIVGGERRWKAAQMAGLTEIPCRVIDAQDEVTVLEDQIGDNFYRDGLKEIELARSWERWLRITGRTQADLAEKFHVSNATVSRALSLLLLPPDLQDKVGDEPGMIPPSTATELVALPDEATLRQWAGLVMDRRANRAQVQEARHALVGKKTVTPKGNKITVEWEGIRLVISNGEALDLEHVTSALSAALKRAKKATSIDDLKGGQS